MNCPLNDPALCRISSSIELVGDRGIVQTNCSACGSGCAVTLSRAQAEQLQREQTAHQPPDASRDSSPDEPTELAPQEPARPKRKRS